VLHELLFTLVSVMSSVILMLRTYAFSGRKKKVLAVLSITLFILVGVSIWVMSKQLTRLSEDFIYQGVFLTLRWNHSVPLVQYRTHRLFRPFGSTIDHFVGHCCARCISLSSTSRTLARLSDCTDIRLSFSQAISV
jgi:hypothetical protein